MYKLSKPSTGTGACGGAGIRVQEMANVLLSLVRVLKVCPASSSLLRIEKRLLQALLCNLAI